MSYAALDWAYSLRLGASSLKAVLVALAKSCKEHKPGFETCFPSLTTLAEMTDLARSTVCAALNVLEDQGLIERERGGGRLSTTYRLRLDRGAELMRPRRNRSRRRKGAETAAPHPTGLFTPFKDVPIIAPPALVAGEPASPAAAGPARAVPDAVRHALKGRFSGAVSAGAAAAAPISEAERRKHIESQLAAAGYGGAARG